MYNFFYHEYMFGLIKLLNLMCIFILYNTLINLLLFLEYFYNYNNQLSIIKIINKIFYLLIVIYLKR